MAEIISNIKIINSDFIESSFASVKIKKMSLNNVNFCKSEFLKVNMSGTDFSSCEMNDILFDIGSVKGIVLNQFQCVELASLLGVIIK